MTTTTPRKRAPRKVAAPKLEETTVVVEETSEETAVEEVPAAKYVAVRKLTFRGKVYSPGDPVPGAEEISRIETWVTHRYLKEA